MHLPSFTGIGLKRAFPAMRGVAQRPEPLVPAVHVAAILNRILVVDHRCEDEQTILQAVLTKRVPAPVV